ncbi:sensor histidine kinase [Devosia sp. 66-22]|uniref:sensor histidine kinase n=1 Tax=Devosia sp. 66-22 TaxID=1895753 RepID=UPI00092844E0|nr:sensor histidine kinase [Devosia sp. 66-22]OJX52395.1 MAG: sensor histidine kinase [Devosia sp. 66-22]
MTQSYSLRRRLVLGLLAALLAIAALAVADSWREAQQTATRVSDRVLAGSILAIAERVIVTEDGTLEVDVPYVALEMLTSSAQDRVFYRVDGSDGFITGYQQLPVVPGAGTEIVYEDLVFRGDAIRLGSLQRAASSGVSAIPFTVTVAETTIARSQLAQSLLVQASVRLAILILAAAVIVWFAVSLSLAPLYRLRNAIALRSPDDLSPIRQDVPREVEGLVETINSFMTRLDSALGALRHFTGNASHQLRTPMAIMRTQLALAQRAKTEDERRAAIAAADNAVEHAERVLAQLLLLARIDEAASDALRLDTIDLAALAKTQTAELVPRASAAGIDLGYEGAESAMMRGDAMLLGELLRNLIENAIAYAGSGAEATVGVDRDAAGVRLTVADTGPGVAAAKLPHLRQRFARERADKPGAGLGLAIVEEIAALFGGTTDVTSDAGRGFRVTILLPAS